MRLRHELKFLITKQQYYVLKHRLTYLLDKDENSNEEGNYRVDSLYFDDISNCSLFEKLSGVNYREKYRIRTYGNHRYFIEKKIKRGEYIAKIKDLLSQEEYSALINNDVEYLNLLLKEQYVIKNRTENLPRALLCEVIQKSKERLLRPMVVVSYDREAYVYPYGNVRITFDMNLKSGLNSHDLNDFIGVRVLDDIIFEIKYDDYLPKSIELILQQEGLVRQALSKYVLCRQYTKLNQWEDQ